MNKKITIEEQITKVLSVKFKPDILEVINKSSEHSEHPAMENVDSLETHFEIKIKSRLFANKTALERHKLVMNSINFAFDLGVHAVEIKTLSCNK